MWRFVESNRPCSIEDCKEEVIVTNPYTGERLCRKHASGREGVLEEARIFLQRYQSGTPKQNY
ncbi:MAG: hypothetical protein ACOCX4_06510 [Planctomycetota bacterium]